MIFGLNQADRGPETRFGLPRDKAHGLIQQDGHLPCLGSSRLLVERDCRRGINPSPEFAHPLPVDEYPATLDIAVGFAPRTQATLSHQFGHPNASVRGRLTLRNNFFTRRRGGTRRPLTLYSSLSALFKRPGLSRSRTRRSVRSRLFSALRKPATLIRLPCTISAFWPRTCPCLACRTGAPIAESFLPWRTLATAAHRLIHGGSGRPRRPRSL